MQSGEFDAFSIHEVALAVGKRRRLRFRCTRAADYFGARLARMRCKVRRCILSRRAVSETLRPHNS